MTGARGLLLVGLAFRDLRHGWRSASCLAVAVGVALVPLLLLFGLKAGVVENLIEELRGDPRVRELALSRDAVLPDGLLAMLSADPRAGFVLPRALHLSSSVRMSGPDPRRKPEPRMVPTAAGDPYLEGRAVPEGLDEVVLTAIASTDTGAVAGDTVTLDTRRTRNGEAERLSRELTVLSVLPPGRPRGDDIFVSAHLEWAIDQWKQDPTVAALEDVPPPDMEVRQVSGFRLFAADVRDVPGLRDTLLSKGVAVETRATAIEGVLAIEAGLTWVFTVVSVLSAAGFLVTLGLHLAASVVEKARELSILRLLGLGRAEVGLVPSLQGAMIGGTGALCAGVLALMAQPSVNASLAGLAGLSGDVSRLTALHLAAAVGAAVAAGAIAGVVAGLRAGGLSPAEGLRRE